MGMEVMLIIRSKRFEDKMSNLPARQRTYLAICVDVNTLVVIADEELEAITVGQCHNGVWSDVALDLLEWRNGD